MPNKRPVRKGKGVADRPTEWSAAITSIVVAFFMWQTDHNTAALVSVVMGALPALVTAAVSWWESSHADTVTVTEAIKED